MKLKQFQTHDLARLACTPGAILAWDPGLGKTWAEILWALLKVGFRMAAGMLQPLKPVLLIVPGGLHEQTIEEARKHFRVHITRLGSQETFEQLAPAGQLPPGFYITSFTQLGLNGIAKLPSSREIWNDPEQVLHLLQSWDKSLTVGRAAVEYEIAWQEAQDTARLQRLSFVPLSLVMPNAPVSSDRKAPLHYKSLTPSERAWFLAQWCEQQLARFAAGIGTDRTHQNKNQKSEIRIKCVYSPSLADLCTHTFEAVAVDEATKMKSDTGILANAVRQLQPPFRLVLTATPIKNRLPDLFHLLMWAVAANKARFPYEPDGRPQFAADFCVAENVVAINGELADNGRKSLTPQVCNVHKLWKMIAPNILRRRKKDIGTAIVPKQNHLIRVPMGTLQRAIVRTHLDWKPLDRNGRTATGPKLAALRLAAVLPEMTPHYQLTLARLLDPDRFKLHDIPPLSADIADPARAVLEQCPQTSFLPTPKLAAALKIIQQILARGEQFVLFCPFIEPLEHLGRILDQASVRHHLLTGDVSEARRGRIVTEFRKGPHATVNYSVKARRPQPSALNLQPLAFSPSSQSAGLLVTECMAEGHNLPKCNNIILYSYPWALDKVLQVIDRVHRLNSEKPVNVYRLITDGTIDRRMEQGIDEKEDAQELVLDGHLLGEAHAELSARELLQTAEQEFAGATDTCPEIHLLTELAAITRALEQTMRTWPYPPQSTRLPVRTPALAAGPSWRDLIRTRPAPALQAA